jgi:peptidoglycan/xylan/chitin deacetylase (PgdA/CDA1 family)
MLTNKQLIPLGVFCFVFLLYSLYFVKVLQNPQTPTESKILRVATESTIVDTEKPRRLSEIPVTEVFGKAKEILSSEIKLENPIKRYRYVQFAFLNLRESAGTSGAILEQLSQNDRVEILEFTSEEWAHIQAPSGSTGYVSRQYLAEEPVEVAYSQIVITPILQYHHITDEPVAEPAVLVLPNVNFDVQISYLVSNGFTTITFEDLAKNIDEKTTPSKKSVILAFDDGYADHYQAAQKLKNNNLKGVFFIITSRIGTEGYLTWHQVREMSEWGMEIGSHGASKNYLGASSPEELTAEVSGSKQTIEKELNKKVYAFAYPSGQWTNTTKKAVIEAGYTFARTQASGDRYNLNKPYSLPVLRIFPLAGERQLKAWLE